MRKIVVRTVVALLVLAAIAVAGLMISVRFVESRIADFVGPIGKIERIHVGFSSVVLEGVTLDGEENWPADNALKAARIIVHPDWRALIAKRNIYDSVRVEDFVLTAVRQGNGQIDALPSLRKRAQQRSEEARARGETEKRETRIGKIEFAQGRIDYYDAVVSKKPPHHIPIANVNATIAPLHFPLDDARTDIRITGNPTTKGSTGKLNVEGWIALASRNADVNIALSQVDVALFSPYLRRDSPLAFNGGRLDMRMRSRVDNQKLNANGQLVLHDLKLRDEGLAALPKKAALAMLEDNKGRAVFDFTMTGTLKSPQFKLDDDISARVAGGLASTLGISVENMAGGLGSAVEGIGGALSNLFAQ